MLRKSGNKIEVSLTLGNHARPLCGRKQKHVDEIPKTPDIFTYHLSMLLPSHSLMLFNRVTAQIHQRRNRMTMRQQKRCWKINLLESVQGWKYSTVLLFIILFCVRIPALGFFASSNTFLIEGRWTLKTQSQSERRNYLPNENNKTATNIETHLEETTIENAWRQAIGIYLIFF